MESVEGVKNKSKQSLFFKKVCLSLSINPRAKMIPIKKY